MNTKFDIEHLTQLGAAASGLDKLVSTIMGQHVVMSCEALADRHGDVALEIKSNAFVPEGRIAQMLFASMRVGGFNRSVLRVDETSGLEYVWFRLYASYEHHGGGSNGHELTGGHSGEPIVLVFYFTPENATDAQREYCGRWIEWGV